MNLFTSIRRKFRSFTQRRAVREEIDEELRYHLEMRTQDNLAGGMPPGDAKRAARKRFGNLESVRGECRQIRGAAWLDNLSLDLRFGFKVLLKQPVALVAALAALAFGIGLVTLVFCGINGILMQKLPLPEGKRLVSTTVPAWAFKSFAEQQSCFDGMVSFGASRADFQAFGDASKRSVCFAGANIFDVLRARPLLGRNFLPGEDKPGADPVAILGYDLWQAEFQGRPDVIGAKIKIDGQPRTIVGVMPKDFHFPIFESVWVASDVSQELANRNQGFVFGRLKPGVTMAAARAELNTIWTRVQPPQNKPGAVVERIRVGAYADAITGALYGQNFLAATFLAVLLATLLVLFLACANVAMLTLSSAAKRGREFAVRCALGATRRRIVFQLFAENLLLSAGGATAGTLAAVSIKRVLMAQMPADMSGARGFASWWRFDIDARVLLFVAGITFLASLVAGLWPAFQATRHDLVNFLKDQTSGSAGVRIAGFQRLLISSQVAASMVLLVGTAAVVRHGRQLGDTHLPFDPGTMLTAELEIPEGADTNRFFFDVESAMRRIPGVDAVGLTSAGFALSRGIQYIQTETSGQDANPYEWRSAARIVSPDYFKTAGLTLNQGRGFEAEDTAGSPLAAVVNTTFARTLLRTNNPLGCQFRQEPNGRWLTVVGCVPDALVYGNGRCEPVYYLPLSQHPTHKIQIMVRGRNPQAWTQTLRHELVRVQPNLPLPSISTVRQELDGVDSGLRGSALLLGASGLVSLFLAAIGIFGLVNLSVSQRTREIGIRLALGGTRARVTWTILGQSLKQIGAGLAAGIIVSALLMRVLVVADVLPAGAGQPVNFVVAVLLLGVTSVVAVLTPVRRATRVDPMTALRYE